MQPSTGLIAALTTIALVQGGPLVHFLVVRRLSPCLRSSYCLLYIMLVAMAWMGLVILMDITHAAWFWFLPILALPLAFWGFLAATHFRTACDDDGANCPIR